MAIFTPINGLLRGSIGANTYSHNKGGDYVRLRSTPTNPMSSRQQATRTILGNFAVRWSNALTQDQRDAWDVYAQGHPVKNSLGQDVYISGLAWYVKVNSRLADAALTARDDPPVWEAPDGLTSLAISFTAATSVDVTFAPVIGGAYALQLWGSLPVSVGSSPNKAQCRLFGYSGQAEASPWSATAPHSFAVGLRCVAYCGVLNEQGLMSAFQQAIDDVSY